MNRFIPIAAFLTIDLYLSLSLIKPLYGHALLFYGALITLQLIIASLFWLLFYFFMSDADTELKFEKPIQKFAFYGMGLISFLSVFALARDAVGIVFFFNHPGCTTLSPRNFSYDHGLKLVVRVIWSSFGSLSNR